MHTHTHNIESHGEKLQILHLNLINSHETLEDSNSKSWTIEI